MWSVEQLVTDAEEAGLQPDEIVQAFISCVTEVAKRNPDKMFEIFDRADVSLHHQITIVREALHSSPDADLDTNPLIKHYGSQA